MNLKKKEIPGSVEAWARGDNRYNRIINQDAKYYANNYYTAVNRNWSDQIHTKGWAFQVIGANLTSVKY